VTGTRTIVVGDVHGCAGELESLLERVRFASGDRVVMVGDLVARGPDSRGVLALVRQIGARSVRGNHEEKLLAWRRRGSSLGEHHAHVASSLSDEDWRMLEEMPLWIDLPEHELRVVHAGVVPGEAIEETPVGALLKMRTIDREGRWSDLPDAGRLWGSLYEGPPHVAFGHNAREDLQVWPWATGLDTACVYGGRLSALVIDEGEPVPRTPAALRARITSVEAARKYYSP
jgi:hypothetical protein